MMLSKIQREIQIQPRRDRHRHSPSDKCSDDAEFRISLAKLQSYEMLSLGTEVKSSRELKQRYSRFKHSFFSTCLRNIMGPYFKMYLL